MKLKMLSVGEINESPTNTKGRTKGEAFDELVASIKEKGVLQPILVRPMVLEDREGFYEVIAGNRRLAAAKKLGLKEIPAQVTEDITDADAMEAQIVENLQRSDIHPMDEGIAYRNLIEESKLEVAAIAPKIGKSETYVRDRLYLTNLGKKGEEAYREGKINDGHAVLIAKLGEEDQKKALEFTIDKYRTPSVADLKRWIHENVYVQLGNQPWTNGPDKQVEEWKKIVGDCQECEPNKASLFGRIKEGNCTNTKCWARKMGKWIEHRVKEEKLVKVSNDYGRSEKGIIEKGSYVITTGRKEKCDSQETAIVAAGSNMGQTFPVCRSKDCEKHYGGRSHYGLTAKEKEQRKKEAAKLKAKLEKEEQELVDTLKKKIKWPMKEGQFDKLLEIMIASFGSSVLRPICKRHAFPEIKGPKNEYTENPTTDWEKTLVKGVEALDSQGKIRMAFEIALEHVWVEKRRKFLKTL